MAWVWTDELAARLVEDGVTEGVMGEWVARPVGVAVPEGADPVQWGARMMGIDVDPEASGLTPDEAQRLGSPLATSPSIDERALESSQ
jgi:hypothetical protein